MNDTLGWAILGTGKIANRFAYALKNLPERARIVAVGSRRRETAAEFAAQWGIHKCFVGYEEVAADPDVDIVYIGTPGVFHRRDVSMCLNNGKHVLCEKALTVNADEAWEVVNLARQKRLFLMEAMWTRFFPTHARVRELLADEALGELRGLIAPFVATVPADPQNRFYDINLGAGVLLDLGSYGVSWAYDLFGAPEEVTGLAVFGDTGADYQSACLLRFARGQIATITASMISYDVKEAVVYGNRGKIVVHEPWYKPTALTLYRESKEPKRYDFPLKGYNGYEYEAQAVMDCILEGKTECDVMPLDQSIEIMKILDQIRGQWGFIYPCEVKV
jgi:dihydrodiol dehydrogenase / D-xylose 1-dehydrogenase (NADP)